MKLAAAALFAIAAAASAQTPRGTVITDTLWSQALGASKPIVIYLPPSYRADANKRYPVVFYLHGLEGDETNWSKPGKIAQAMDSLVAAGKPEMIIAMPDGDDSWYATYNLLLDMAGCRRVMLPDTASDARVRSDCVAWPHYDDYIAYDVVKHVDSKYRTIARGSARGIGGLSMGGYGAITLALQYPGTFAAAASHSGVLWPREMAPAPMTTRLPHRASDSTAMASFARRNAAKLRPVFGSDSAGWLARDPATLAARLKARGVALPPLFADGGTEDPFLAQSRRFRDAMQTLGVPLEYHEWPGGHNWAYWSAHVGESLAWLGSQITRR